MALRFNTQYCLDRGSCIILILQDKKASLKSFQLVVFVNRMVGGGGVGEVEASEFAQPKEIVNKKYFILITGRSTISSLFLYVYV